MSPGLLYAIKTCGWATLSQVGLPEPLHPSSFPLAPYNSFIYPSHYPSTQLSGKHKRPIFPFLLNGGSSHSAVHPFILTMSSSLCVVVFAVFMKEEMGLRLSSWIIHNQFHGEQDGWETNEWSAGGISAWANHPARVSWLSALFSLCNGLCFLLIISVTKTLLTFEPEALFALFSLLKGHGVTGKSVPTWNLVFHL